MGIRSYRSSTAGTRNRSISEFMEIIKSKPEKKLTSNFSQRKGRNNRGVITCRHRGGGHKRLYRTIDFKRDKKGIKGTILNIQYDPNRNARIALVSYTDGEKRYIIHPRGVIIGDMILSGLNAPIFPGNTLPLSAV